VSNKIKGPPRGPQLPAFFFLSPEEREKSPAWRALRNTGESLARVRKHLPQYPPEQLERMRALRRQAQLPAGMVEFARRWRAWWPEQAQQAAQTPDQQPTRIEQPPSKHGPGAPRLEFPHLPEALEALGEKWPQVRWAGSKIVRRHIQFVISFCRQHGDKVNRVYGEDGVSETQKQTFRRRIKEWQKPPP
jgi:hypothetical protein